MLRVLPDVTSHWRDVDEGFDTAATRLVDAHTKKGDARDPPIRDPRSWRVIAQNARFALARLARHSYVLAMASSDRDSRFPEAAWIRRHRRELLRWFPTEVIASPKRFGLVVQEAIDFETGWCPDWLSEDDARTLLRFLHRHDAGPGDDLVRALERRRATTGRVLQTSRQRRGSSD